MNGQQNEQSTITKAIQELEVDRVRCRYLSAPTRMAIAVPFPTLGSLLLGVHYDPVVAMELRGRSTIIGIAFWSSFLVG